jgi:hypothetical protein
MKGRSVPELRDIIYETIRELERLKIHWYRMYPADGPFGPSLRIVMSYALDDHPSNMMIRVMATLAIIDMDSTDWIDDLHAILWHAKQNAYEEADEKGSIIASDPRWPSKSVQWSDL